MSNRPTRPLFSLLLCFGISLNTMGETDNSLHIEQLRQARDETIWKQEKSAQRYETPFIELWDRLRESGHSFETFHNFEFSEIALPELLDSTLLAEGITRDRFAIKNAKTSPKRDFDHRLQEFKRLGIEVDQSEWHHADFKINENGTASSVVSFAIHARQDTKMAQRFIVRGKLLVTWSDLETGQDSPKADKISFQDLEILSKHTTKLAFHEIDWKQSRPRLTPYSHVIVEDLNGDGLPDILFPKSNEVHFNRGDFQFEQATLAQFPIRGQVTAAAIVDLNLDGIVEYVVAVHNAPYLFAYSFDQQKEMFADKPFGIWKSDTPLAVQLIAAGDITGDGRPELYIGQSTTAYENGKMPTPYFDANDGNPAYLLRNLDGFRYEDMTHSTDVSNKRGRRAYIASFQDLDEDGQLDLIVNSDFSGLDLYRNEKGTLVDRTADWVDNRSLFGMSHTFADFDRDGSTDLLAVGMSSTTARRLENMGLGRSEFPEHQAMRMEIAYGNRLYFGNANGTFKQRPSSENVARSGWSWGSAALDFNNDSYPDIFIANGYLSKTTARDYCTNFWTHDIYEEKTALSDSLKDFYNKLGPKSLVGGNKMSWNPFEKDHLYLNLAGERFVNISYLCGVSKGGDGRVAIGEDFDRDGKVDLLLVEQDSVNALEKISLFRNQFETDGNWIGVNLDRTTGKAIIGARIRVVSADYTTERIYTVGGSYASQTSTSVHFGIGTQDKLTKLEVLWPDGSETTLPKPQINRYHTVK